MLHVEYVYLELYLNASTDFLYPREQAIDLPKLIKSGCNRACQHYYIFNLHFPFRSKNENRDVGGILETGARLC